MFLLNFNENVSVPLSDFYEAVKRQKYWKVTSAANGKHEKSIDDYIEEHLKGPLFISAPAISLRQQIQQGKYIIFSNDICSDTNGGKGFGRGISPIDDDNGAIIGKIIIDCRYKARILDELKMLGVSKYSLFSDSVDIVCEGIRYKYS